jgi:hypothetical protein
MIIRLVGSVMALVVLGSMSPVFSDGSGAGSGSNDFFVYVAEETSGSTTSPTAQQASSIVGSVTSPVCAIGGDQTCAETAVCDNGTPMTVTMYITEGGQSLDGGTNCPEDAVAIAAPPQVTPGLVLQALRRIDLPASDLNVQPPGGRTLVNFETNFFTENGEFTRTVRLLGQRVELRIWPASFGWRFGDGSATTTSDPGSPYPHLDITHRYLDKGRVSPSVDTTYAARFRVGGGPWRDVNGTVTIPGSPEGLRVVTARPVLVGD